MLFDRQVDKTVRILVNFYRMYHNSDIFPTISHSVLGFGPPLAHRVVRSSRCAYLSHSDWCLQSDAMPATNPKTKQKRVVQRDDGEFEDAVMKKNNPAHPAHPAHPAPVNDAAPRRAISEVA